MDGTYGNNGGYWSLYLGDVRKKKGGLAGFYVCIIYKDTQK